MDTEAAVINGFFTFRVFLVGAILLAYPRISRKGLMFGTYLGEDTVDGPAAGKLMRSWDVGCAVVMGVSLLIGWGISLSGQPIRGNLTGTAVLLLLSPALYVWMYRKARRQAPSAVARQAMQASASLDVDESPGDRFALLTLIVCLLTALASAAYAILSYETLPDRIPTLANLMGLGDESADKSITAFLLVPSFNLVLSPFFALMALLVARAKRSLRGGSGGRSAEAQVAFRTAYSHLFSGIALFVCLLFTVTSLAMINVARGGESGSLGILLLCICVAMIFYAGFSLFRLMKRFGQGGARLETGSVEAPLTGALADNARWILGVMYVDKADPSLMVESRFGLGYTFNFGNPIAIALNAIYLTTIFGLVVLTLMELGVF